MTGAHTAPLLVAGALLIVSAASLIGQSDNHYLSELPGGVTALVEPSDRSLHGMSAADAVAYERALGRIRGVLLEQPVFHPLLGADVRGYFRTDHQRSRIAASPVPGYGVMKYYPAVLYRKSGKPGWLIATTDEVVVYVNNPVGGFGRLNALRDRADYFYEPERTGEIGGLPLFRGELACEYVVLSQSGHLPWIPVTREEYVREWTADWQKRVDGYAGDTVSPRVVARHKEILAAMPPDERRMQARHFGSRDPLGPPMPPPGSREGKPLVKADPEWFDKSLPRSAVQLVIVKFWYSGEIDPDRPAPTRGGQVSALRVWDTLHRSDWKAIRERIFGPKESIP